MNRDLIERYIYAVTKNLPKKSRKDIQIELRTLIDDMLEERTGDVVPTEQDIKVVLTELGTPTEMASKYDQDTFNALIGQPYYTTYKFVLSIVVAAVAFGITVSMFVLAIVEPGTVWYLQMFQWISSVAMGAVSAFGFVTLLFAIFERKGVQLDFKNESLDNLPPVPKTKERISKSEPIFSIVITVVFGAIFLTTPQIIGIYDLSNGTSIAVFNVAVVRSLWYLIFGFFALSIIRDGYKLFERRYTKRLAIITVITNSLSAFLFRAFIFNKNIFNPQADQAIKKLFENQAPFIASFFNRLPLGIFVVVIFALMFGIVTTVYKAIKYDK